MSYPTPQEIENRALALSTHDDLVYAFSSLYGRLPVDIIELEKFHTLLDAQRLGIAQANQSTTGRYNLSLPGIDWMTAYVTANSRMPSGINDFATWLKIDLSKLLGTSTYPAPDWQAMAPFPQIGFNYPGNPTPAAPVNHEPPNSQATGIGFTDAAGNQIVPLPLSLPGNVNDVIAFVQHHPLPVGGAAILAWALMTHKVRLP